MFNAFAFVGLPLLFMADYLAIIIWLMRASKKPDQPFRFSLRTLLIAITIAAIHLGTISAFLSASP